MSNSLLKQRFLARKEWKKSLEKKRNISGAGPFLDQNGRPNINGNTIYLKWNRSLATTIFMTFFALFWNFISWVMVWAMLYNDAPVTVNGAHFNSFSHAFAVHPWIAIFALFPLFGVIMFYGACCTWVNRTVFKFDGRYIGLSHGPLPAGKSIQIDVGSINQLYTEMHTRTVTSKNRGRRTVTTYRLKVLLNSGGEKILFSQGASYNEVRILEQWFESKLGIEDRSVPGEVA